MIKLLRAGVRRYLHSVVFWLASIVTVAVAVLCANGARNFYLEDFYIMIEFIIFAVMISWLSAGNTMKAFSAIKLYQDIPKSVFFIRTDFGRRYLFDFVFGIHSSFSIVQQLCIFSDTFECCCKDINRCAFGQYLHCVACGYNQLLNTAQSHHRNYKHSFGDFDSIFIVHS